MTYVDSEAGWIEKTLKIPNDQITNPKKLKAMELFISSKRILLRGVLGIRFNFKQSIAVFHVLQKVNWLAVAIP